MDANKPKEGHQVLVVAPHADDMEFGCAGYVTKLVDQGARVDLLVMCLSAVYSTKNDRVVHPDTRLEEQEAVARLLGLQHWHSYGLPENEGHLKLAEMIDILDEAVKGIVPHEMLVPLPSTNQDHEAVFKACLAVLRPNKTSWQPIRVLAYEQPMNCWGDSGVSGAVQGTVYVPLTQAQIDRKLKALACHKSQVAGREFKLAGHRGALQLAELRGVECGVLYAEKFHLLREVVL